MLLRTDLSLVAAARTDRAALERLIESIWPEAYRIALAVLRDRGLAEDAAQDACATIAGSLAALRNAAAFEAWTYRIVVNAAVTIARRRPPVQSVDGATDAAATTDAAAAIDLDNALAALPLHQRAVVLLHYYAGLRSSDIARATGLPPSTIRFHIMLARRALRKALAVAETPLPNEVLSNAR
ncbi:MAG: RNA polymerase sigma factor [Candidatus Eremiobacteraeota bacterium]|nr:RNA polymerase sigma factor [Candidatus Eremiobacteraeota bacterium]